MGDTGVQDLHREAGSTHVATVQCNAQGGLASSSSWLLWAPPGPWLSLSEPDCIHHFNSLWCLDSRSSQSVAEVKDVRCQMSSENLYLVVSSPSS